jgi:hypothetical protein
VHYARTRRALVGAAVATCIAGGLFGVPSLAKAAEQSPVVALDYSTIEGCPDRNAFLRRVDGRVDFELSDMAVRRLRISFRRDGSSFRGTLEVVEQAKPPMLRELQGADCEVIADGVAVFVALALRSAEPTEPTGPTESDTAPLTEPAEPQPPSKPRSRARPKRAPARPAVRTEKRFGSYFGVSSRTGGSSLSGIAGAAVEASLVDVTLRATLFGGMSEPPPLDGVRIELGIVRLRLEACPEFASLQAGSFELLPCVGAAGGIRWARALGLRTEIRPSFEFGGGAHARYWFDARRTLGLDLSVALDAAATTYAYSHKRDDTTVLETRTLVGDVGLGLLVRW